MSNGKTILVVDDEERIRKLIRDFFFHADFTVLEAADGEEALEVYYKHPEIDVIILDVMMPKMDGFMVCKEIRTSSDVPILFLTAKTDERDELKGFEMGVDEYVEKPFSPKVLVARVQAILGRQTKKTSSILEEKGIRVDKDAHEVCVDGKKLELSVKEFELLCFFMENKGLALSREQILNQVWNYDYFGDARTIDTHVKKLRSKLGEKGEYISTIWGMGYKFEA